MIFKPAIWYPIAVALSVVNLVALGFYAAAEPGHAAAHGLLALGFGLWARRLRQRSDGSERRSELGERELGGGDLQARLEELEAEATRVRQELSEAQERLDFAERLLAQRPEPRRPSPQD